MEQVTITKVCGSAMWIERTDMDSTSNNRLSATGVQNSPQQSRGLTDCCTPSEVQAKKNTQVKNIKVAKVKESRKRSGVSEP